MPNAELRDFLMSRRARITAEHAGFLNDGRRRVVGLRRSEVAALAGISTDYYKRLERGIVDGVSPSVLNGLSRALQLDHAERVHLADLLSIARRSKVPHPRRPPLRPSVQWMLDSMATAPAFVRDPRLDVVAINALGRAFYCQMLDSTDEPANFARFCFLDSRARELYPDWDHAATITIGMLRMAAGHDPLDRDLWKLLRELAARSEDFRIRWATHDVWVHRVGVKKFVHPVVGPIEVAYNSMDLPAAPGLVLTVYNAEPGSPSANALRLLAKSVEP